MSEIIEPDEIVLQLRGSFSGLEVTHSFGETSIFYNPEKKHPRGTYFCTIKLKDGPNDKASELDRDGVFRVSFALPEDIYQEQFGSPPARGDMASIRSNPKALNKLTPHPVYARMRWVQILSPSPEKFKQLQPFIKESYNLALIRHKGK